MSLILDYQTKILLMFNKYKITKIFVWNKRYNRSKNGFMLNPLGGIFGVIPLEK